MIADCMIHRYAELFQGVNNFSVFSGRITQITQRQDKIRIFQPDCFQKLLYSSVSVRNVVIVQVSKNSKSNHFPSSWDSKTKLRQTLFFVQELRGLTQ